MMTSQWSTSALALTYFVLVMLCATYDVTQAMPAKHNLEQPLGASTSLDDDSVLGLLPSSSDAGLDGGHSKLKRSISETQASSIVNEYDRIKSIRNLMKSLGPDEVRKVVSALSVIREFLLRQKTVIERAEPRVATPWAQTRRQQRNFQGAMPDFKEEVRRMGPEFNPTGW